MTRARLLAVLLLAVWLLAGCGGEKVAQVDGTTIRLSDVEALYQAAAIPAADFRLALFRVAVVEVLDQALAAEFQVEVQPAQVEEKLAGLEAMLAESGMTAAQYLGVEEASDEMLWFNAEVLALQELALDQLVVDPEVVDGLFADPATLTTVCSRHILVGTEEEAEEVEARLAAGEDFAAVADEVSLDTRSEGGDLGCVLAGSFAPEYRAAAMEAAIGEVTGPVAVESGFHLLVVYERTAHTREEYLSAPRSLLSEDLLSGIWSDWYLARLQAADVWVNERYGTWSTGGILAPSAGE